MRTLIRVSDGLSRLFGAVSMILLAMATAVVTQMVFMRYILNASTVWQTEFVIFSLVGATFLGAPYVLLRKGHVGVDLLPEMLKGGAGRALRLVAMILSLAFCIAVTWSGAHYFYEAATRGWTTETVWALPLWIPLLPLPLGFGMMCIQILAEMAKIIRPELAA